MNPTDIPAAACAATLVTSALCLVIIANAKIHDRNQRKYFDKLRKEANENRGFDNRSNMLD